MRWTLKLERIIGSRVCQILGTSTFARMRLKTSFSARAGRPDPRGRMRACAAQVFAPVRYAGRSSNLTVLSCFGSVQVHMRGSCVGQSMAKACAVLPARTTPTPPCRIVELGFHVIPNLLGVVYFSMRAGRGGVCPEPKSVCAILRIIRGAFIVLHWFASSILSDRRTLAK